MSIASSSPLASEDLYEKDSYDVSHEGHALVKHGSVFPSGEIPRTFSGLAEWLKGQNFEGLVFHHPDGRMAKIKKRDFGLKRHPKE